MSAVSDLIFSELATNFSHTLTALKRSNLSLQNRFSSILDDSEFVCLVSDVFDLPLVANERCGSWYIPPKRKAGSVYFKSTDGHMGQWSFSLRRLNLQLLHLLATEGGCIIVDSTRRGKSMPDALSKTVPIWCAVINRLLFPDSHASHTLHSPESCVSKSEHHQISELLEVFYRNVSALHMELSHVQSILKKPLRPFWVTRDTILPSNKPQYSDTTPVILCTASRRVEGAEMSAAGYIQGAGDDSESWAHGLTPVVFWPHKQLLLETSEADLPKIIEKLLDEAQASSLSRAYSAQLIPPTTRLFVGQRVNIANVDFNGSDVVLSCGAAASASLADHLKGRYLHLQCRMGKLGSRDLRKEMVKIPAFFHANPQVDSIYVVCDTGKDLSIGIALALLCLYFDATGAMQPRASESPALTKAYIKQRLSWLTIAMPYASPSRATLQSVNDFLFSGCLG